MKKSFYFFTVILFIASLSLTAAIKNEPDEHKVDLWAQLGSEGRPKAYVENPLEVFLTTSTLDVYFYINYNLKVDVYNESGALFYTKAVNKYGGQILNINTNGWKKGKYKIIITEITYKGTYTGQFNIK